jgi:hypothetical protein
LRLKNLKGEHQQVADMIRDLNTRMVMRWPIILIAAGGEKSPTIKSNRPEAGTKPGGR